MKGRQPDVAPITFQQRHELDHDLLLRELQDQQRALLGIKLALTGLALISVMVFALTLVVLWPA
jgi:hypothetical protein